MGISVSKAKRLVSGFDWAHLGFAFFWAVTFVSLVNPAEGLQADSVLFSNFKQGVTIAACLLVAVIMRKRAWFSPNCAFSAGVMLSAGSLMYYLAFFFGEYSLAACLLSSALVGGATGWFYVMWQSFYASEGSSRTAVFIPLSCALSVAISLVVCTLPIEWTVLMAVVVLPSAASWALHKSLSQVEPYRVRPLDKQAATKLVRDMWKPIFCVCALGFVWQIVGYLEQSQVNSTSVVVMIAMGAAAVLVAAIELFSDEGINVMRMYQLLFPLVTAAFLIPTMLGQQWLGLVSGLVMFGFEVLNLFLLITCAVYASRLMLNPVSVYAICVCPTLVSLLAGDLVGAHLGQGLIMDFTKVVDVMFVCVYLLSLVMFLVSATRARKSHEAELAIDCALDAPSATAEEPAKDPRQAILDAASEPLSAREKEVLDLILKGNTVAAISHKLFISENTVRGHFKHIYRKLGVHSKQELVDLFS